MTKIGENKIGVIGELLAAFALVFDTIPWFGWFLLGAAYVVNIIGLFKKPRQVAGVGLLISFFATLGLLLQLYLKMN